MNEPNFFDEDMNAFHYQGENCYQIIEELVYDTESFLIGNIIKYLYRRNNKGTKLDDLRKARWYLNKLIEEVEELNEV